MGAVFRIPIVLREFPGKILAIISSPAYDSIPVGHDDSDSPLDRMARPLAMQTKYTPHIAMEIAIAATVVFLGYALTAIRDHPYWTIRGGVMFLAVLIMWFAMQCVVVADDAIVLHRRLGWFKRRIPLAQISNIDVRMVPCRDGAAPTLYIHTTDKRKYKVSLFSNDRHIQVVVDIRSRMDRLKNARNYSANGTLLKRAP